MRKILLALILASIVILSGVNGCPKQEEKVSTTGLEMAFVESAPPVSSVVGSEFPIYVDITNIGGELINKGEAKFYLKNVEYFENVKSSLTNARTLEKESTFPERLVFAEKAKFTFPLKDVFSPTLVMTACYPYSDTTQATICVSVTNESKVCSLSGEKITSSTAGPIQVTSITESVSGERLTVRIDIANKASGQIYLLNTDCDKLEANDVAESSQKQGKVNVNIITKDDFACRLQAAASPYNQIAGLEGTVPIGSVICEKTLAGKEHSSPFIVVLKYKYRDSISKIVNIVSQ